MHAFRFIVLFLYAGLSGAADFDVRLNTLGFLPDQAKQATVVSGTACAFHVEPADGGAAVLRGKTTEPVLTRDSDETVVTADLSAVTAPGRYRLVVDGVGTSVPFAVAADLYAVPFQTVLRGFYLWRCGCAVSNVQAGVTNAHAACHLDDAWLDYVGKPGVHLDATGGWHDAGDYNKYTANAGITMGLIGKAWEMFPKRAGRDLRLPDHHAGIPDILTEMRYEMDWLLRMQVGDGSVYERTSTLYFGAFVAPEKENTKRFLGRPTTGSTAAFTAVAAQMARLMEPFDKPYSVRCLAAARNSWAWCEAHPDKIWHDSKNFSTGAYEIDDATFRLWAAAELWATTGEAAYLAAFEKRLATTKPCIIGEFNWTDVRDLAVVAWLLSARTGRNEALAADACKALCAAADKLVATHDRHAYGRPLTTYSWGGNGSVANTCFVLAAADRVSPSPRYRAVALDAVGYLFGRNAHCRSYVTGLGANPPLHPHDRRVTVTAWPGYLVGGPWRDGENSRPALRWSDQRDDYETNEIAINWNAGLVLALAWFAPESSAAQNVLK